MLFISEKFGGLHQRSLRRRRQLQRRMFGGTWCLSPNIHLVSIKLWSHNVGDFLLWCSSVRRVNQSRGLSVNFSALTFEPGESTGCERFGTGEARQLSCK